MTSWDDRDDRDDLDETGDHELDDDLLADEELTGSETEEWDGPDPDEGTGEEEAVDADPGTAESEPGEREHLDSEELAVVSAETVEWSPDDAGSTGERDAAEPAVAVGAAAAGDGRGFLGTVGHGLGAPFRVLGRMGFPLWARFLTASVVIVAAVGAATAISLLLWVEDIAADIRPIRGLDNVLPEIVPGEPQTILVMGSDLRPEDAFYQRQKSGKVTFRGLSDTMMLIRLDPDRNAIAVFSLPRDLKVEIPGNGTDKLNAAYSIGGPKLTYRTIRNLTGLKIHHVVNVDFEGFARAVNAIDCVYVDVDRRYFNKNDPYDGQEDYDEIDIQPGYQALCGYNALDYTRYRHTDNDVVRAARQQDFLREARAKVPAQRIWSERKTLIPIFTEHVSSDINSWAAMLDVLKLFIAAKDEPVKEIHFEGTLGPSYVTATQAQIDTAVNQFLGIKDTPGARGDSAVPKDPRARAEAVREGKGRPANVTRKKRKQKQKAKKKKFTGDAQLISTEYGKQLAKEMRKRSWRNLPIYYPTILEVGSDFAQEPRVYKINGIGEGSPPDGKRPAYKWVFSRPAVGEYYGFMATRWKDPPILDHPSETREIGGREYELFYDGDRLRLIAWQTDQGSFWLSNTLIQSLSDKEMVEIARGMRELPPAKR